MTGVQDGCIATREDRSFLEPKMVSVHSTYTPSSVNLILLVLNHVCSLLELQFCIPIGIQLHRCNLTSSGSLRQVRTRILAKLHAF